MNEALNELGVRQLDIIDKAELNSNLLRKTSLILFVIFGILFLYVAIISKFIHDTHIQILDIIKKDTYFCYLIPLMILPTYAVIYLRWLAMTFFQYN